MNIKIDGSRLVEDWNKYSIDVRKGIDKAGKKALRAVAQELKSTTVKYVKSRLPYSAKGHSRRRKIYYDKIYDGVRVSKTEQTTLNGVIYRGVHVLGTQKPGSGTYRLRFHEIGTSQRLTKRSGKNRGSIRTLSFLGDAQRVVLPKAPEIMRKVLDEEIDKLNAEL